jgi:predicted RNA-binding Zn-ribbon protein involved in translation (DUF1610 family)
MTMEDVHLDGNGFAGLLGEIAGAEMTTAMRTCQSCGDRRALGEHRAYEGAGVVLRCPSCTEVAIVVGVQADRLVVDFRGTFEMARGA